METPENVNQPSPKPGRMSKSTRIFLFSLLAGFLIGPILMVCVPLLDPSSANDESPYHRILIGQDLDAVAKQLGEEGHPRSREDFLKGKDHPFYKYEYQSAERSGAVFFVEWGNRQDPNIRYHVGFDTDKKVIFKARFLRS